MFEKQIEMNRRYCIYQLNGWALMALGKPRIPANEAVMKRIIPSSGEKLPVVGLGTWQTFDVSESGAEREPLKEVLKTLIAKGGSVIDSSPMYGRSEEVVGDLSTALNLNDKLFI